MPPFFWASAITCRVKRRLARALRAVDFDDAALGQAADAERDVEAERAGRNRLDVDLASLAPSRMIEPLPWSLSICASAAANAL